MRNLFFSSRPTKPALPPTSQSRFVWGRTPANRPPLTRPGLWPIGLAGGVFILGGAVWLVLLSPVFQVRQIEIKGEVNDRTRMIIERLKGRNIFLVRPLATESELTKLEPTLKRLRLVRGVPNYLSVEVIERQAKLTWQAMGEFYLVDQEGVAFKKVLEPQGVIVTDETSLPVELGRSVAPTDLINFIDLVWKVLPATTDLQPVAVRIGETTFSPTILSDKGLAIIMDVTEPFDRQMDALVRAWSQKRDQIKKYLDVRVASYVYYQ